MNYGIVSQNIYCRAFLLADIKRDLLQIAPAAGATSSAGGEAARGCPWDVDTVLWRRHTVAIARMCVCAPDDGRTAFGRIGFVVGETPRTAAPACARMSPCGQRAAARLVACESCWQHCRGGEAAHGCSCVRAYGAVVEAHSRSRMCEPGVLLATSRAVLGRIGGDAARSGSCVRVRRRAPGDVRALLGCVVGTCELTACLAWRKPSTHRLLCMYA